MNEWAAENYSAMWSREHYIQVKSLQKARDIREYYKESEVEDAKSRKIMANAKHFLACRSAKRQSETLLSKRSGC